MPLGVLPVCSLVELLGGRGDEVQVGLASLARAVPVDGLARVGRVGVHHGCTGTTLGSTAMKAIDRNIPAKMTPLPLDLLSQNRHRSGGGASGGRSGRGADRRTKHVTKTRSRKSAAGGAASLLFGAALVTMLRLRDGGLADNAVHAQSYRHSPSTNLRGTSQYSRVRRILREDEEEDDDDLDDDDEYLDDDDNRTNQEAADDRAFNVVDPNEQNIAAIDNVMDEIIEHLYSKANHIRGHSPIGPADDTATAPSYLEIFKAHGWRFDGLDQVQDPDLLQQVHQMRYPSRFACTIIDKETGEAKKKEVDVQCYRRLTPLLDVMDATPDAIPDMKDRYRRSIMDRFNMVHTAVRKRIGDDIREERKKRAEEMRQEAGKARKQQNMQQRW